MTVWAQWRDDTVFTPGTPVGSSTDTGWVIVHENPAITVYNGDGGTNMIDPATGSAIVVANGGFSYAFPVVEGYDWKEAATITLDYTSTEETNVQMAVKDGVSSWTDITGGAYPTFNVTSVSGSQTYEIAKFPASIAGTATPGISFQNYNAKNITIKITRVTIRYMNEVSEYTVDLHAVSASGITTLDASVINTSAITSQYSGYTIPLAGMPDNYAAFTKLVVKVKFYANNGGSKGEEITAATGLGMVKVKAGSSVLVDSLYNVGVGAISSDVGVTITLSGAKPDGLEVDKSDAANQGVAFIEVTEVTFK
jgi:hypothetical protein